MTTFEIIVTVAIIAIVMLLGFIAFCVWNHYRDVELSNYMLRKKLDNIDTNTATSVGVGIDLKDIVDKMHRNLCVEIADKMVDRVYPPTYNPPCYSPYGICTNPQMDCINCPKRGTGGTWSTNTSIKAKDAPLQERFNDNKED